VEVGRNALESGDPALASAEGLPAVGYGAAPVLAAVLDADTGRATELAVPLVVGDEGLVVSAVADAAEAAELLEA
jgi:hypothetical protein